MLVEYTSLSELTADQLSRLKSFARTLGESSQPYVVFEGKTLRTAEVRTLTPAGTQQLNG